MRTGGRRDNADERNRFKSPVPFAKLQIWQVSVAWLCVGKVNSISRDDSCYCADVGRLEKSVVTIFNIFPVQDLCLPCTHATLTEKDT